MSHACDEVVTVFGLDGAVLNGVLDSVFVGLDLAEFLDDGLCDVVVGSDDVHCVADDAVLQLEVVPEADRHGQDGVEEVGGAVEAEDHALVTWN